MIGFKSNNIKAKSRKQKRKQDKRKRYTRYGIFAVVVYLFFLVSNLPASIAVSFISDNPQLKRQLQISAVSGSIWSGSAASVQVAGLNLGRVKWDLNLLPLLLGEVNAYINFNNAAGSAGLISGSGTVAVSLGGEISLTKFSAAFSIDALAPLMYGMPARFGGDVRLHIYEMTLLQGKRINIKSRTVISNASLVSPQKINYGDVLVQSSAQALGSHFILTDQGGPLILDGKIKLKGNGIYALNFGLGARDSASSDLANGLRFLGQRDSTGKYHYKMNAKLKNW